MTSTPAQSESAPEAPRGPFRLAVATVFVTTVTIMFGAMTTSTGSGMAFADWPLSDGELMPERSLTTVEGFLEHFHRVIASGTGLCALGLWLWLWLGGRGDRLACRTAFFGGALTLVQGIVGGTGVLNNLPAITSVTHGTLAQLTLATFVWVAYQLSDRYRTTVPNDEVAPGSGRTLAVVAIVVLVIQTVLGAVARHTNSSHALWTHVGHSMVVFIVAAIASAFAVGKLSKTPGVRETARWVVLMLIVQIALGFVALAIRNEAGKTPENIANMGTAAVISVHVLLGALLTVTMTSLAAQVFRATRAAR